MTIDYGILVKCSSPSCGIHKLFFERDTNKMVHHNKHHELYFQFEKGGKKHKIEEGQFEESCKGCSYPLSLAV